MKCNNDGCQKHFMFTEKDTKCPFCSSEYRGAKGAKEIKGAKERKLSVRSEEGSFKIWKEKNN